MPYLSMPFVAELYVGDELKIYASKRENESMNRQESDNNKGNNTTNSKSSEKAESISTSTSTAEIAVAGGNENVSVNSASVHNDFIAAVTCIQFGELQQSTNITTDANLQKNKQHSQKSKNNKFKTNHQSEARECLENDYKDKELIRVCLVADVFTNTDNEKSIETNSDNEHCREDNMQSNLHNVDKNQEVQTLTLTSCYFASHDNIATHDENKEDGLGNENISKQVAMDVNGERHVKLTCPLVFTPQSQVKALRAVAYVEKLLSSEEQQEHERQQLSQQENSKDKTQSSKVSKFGNKRNREYHGERMFVIRLLGQQQTELSARQVVLMSSESKEQELAK